MQIVVRATVMFLFLWIALRAMGRKELAGMSAFELIILVILGDLVQQSVTSQDNSIAGAIIAVSTIILWMLLFSYSSFRFGRAQKLLEGEPVILIRNGRV